MVLALNPVTPYAYSQQPLRHWLPHLWLPVVVFVLLFTLLKMPTPHRLSASYETLQLNLQITTPDNKPVDNLSSTTEPQAKPSTKPHEPRQTAKPAKPTKQSTEPLTKPDPVVQKTKTTEPQEPKVTVSATDLIQQAKTHTDVRISQEFTARTDIKKPPETPWNTTPASHSPYADIPYLASYDLAVEMDFYSEGYRGDIERFFDAVILKKTFTTKYGTKISCALAIVVVCSWK